ncbi:Serine/threonine-protein kinase PBS1 [Zea mays]|uniref:Serine/threonine-protein kinase PBS1 n=1 Tax=Zea mays TaxID=4577 RepID=A0A3L6DRJ4_MAIZE|nr:Serine/threonine-protein kinase PBS1 [Zea mays]
MQPLEEMLPLPQDLFDIRYSVWFLGEPVCCCLRRPAPARNASWRPSACAVPMGCFGCFAPEADEDLRPSKHDDSLGADARRKVAPDVASGYAHNFTFKDLLVATGYFNEANFIGDGGFRKVYKGKINGQMVAVKQLARDDVQGRNEFLVEVLILTVLNHRNLVSLVGFCAQGDERLLHAGL